MTEHPGANEVEFMMNVVCSSCGSVMRRIKAIWPADQYNKFVEKGWIVDGVGVSHSTCDSCASEKANEN